MDADLDGDAAVAGIVVGGGADGGRGSEMAMGTESLVGVGSLFRSNRPPSGKSKIVGDRV